MSDHTAEPNLNVSEMSRKYLNEKQSSWMEHWTQSKRRRANDEYLSLANKNRHETMQHFSLRNHGSEPNGSNALCGIKDGTGSHSSEDGSHSKKDTSNLLSSPVFNLHKNGGSYNQHVPGTQTGDCSEFKAATTSTIKPRTAYGFDHKLQEVRNTTMGCKLLHKETTPNLELELRAHDSMENGCIPNTKSSQMYRKENIIPFASTSQDHVTHRASYQDFNIDIMRMTSTLNGREDIHLGPRMYAERIRHLLITEKMSIGVSDKGSGQVQQGLKLQILDGSTGSEENQKDEDSRSIGRFNRVGNLAEETSSETHTVNVNASLENNLTHGLCISRSNKADTLQDQTTACSQGKSANTWLPDMNELAQASDGSADEGHHSTSQTQSLDMKFLVSNNSNSMLSHVVQPRAELGSRWLKRLKLRSNSYTKYETVCTKSLEEPSSYEKLRKLAMDTHLNQSKGGKGLSIISVKEDRNVLMSDSWIRRWCHGQHQTVKVPVATERFEKKIFPSIAAMALMGKAMNGYRPCEFTKKGNFVVWKTNNGKTTSRN